VSWDGKAIPLQEGIYRALFASWLAPVNASLAFAVTFVLFWFGILYVLYRKQIFFRV
jgi:predicted acyltransferase